MFCSAVNESSPPEYTFFMAFVDFSFLLGIALLADNRAVLGTLLFFFFSVIENMNTPIHRCLKSTSTPFPT